MKATRRTRDGSRVWQVFHDHGVFCSGRIREQDKDIYIYIFIEREREEEECQKGKLADKKPIDE